MNILILLLDACVLASRGSVTQLQTSVIDTSAMPYYLFAAQKILKLPLSDSEQILGWCIHHPGPRRLPSARERTVTASLIACVPSGMPVLFGVLSAGLDHDAATITFENRIFEQASQSNPKQEPLNSFWISNSERPTLQADLLTV